jgi:hypothetical protein
MEALRLRSVTDLLQSPRVPIRVAEIGELDTAHVIDLADFDAGAFEL